MSRYRIGKFFLLLGGTFALVAGMNVQAAESLDCDLLRKGDKSLALTNTILDNQTVVQDAKNPLELRVDASLAPSSFIFVMQDDAKQQRVAFTGAPSSLAWDGARISLSGGTELSCRKKSTEPAKTIPQIQKNAAPYLVCLLDEAIYEGGNIVNTKRILQTVSSAFTFRMPLKVNAETDKYAFTVSSYEFDPLDGLDIKITDKSNGESAHFAGPARSLTSSFMFGFTQGDRAASAKFLRLGCVYTSDPKLFLENVK